MSSASHSSDGELGYATESRDFRDFLDQFDPATENGRYLTSRNINDISKNSSTLSILHLNIRSLNKHANGLVSRLSSFKFSFDCICFTEVHNTNLEHYSSLLNEYKFHPVPSQRGNVGGVCVYAKNDLN